MGYSTEKPSQHKLKERGRQRALVYKEGRRSLVKKGKGKKKGNLDERLTEGYCIKFSQYNIREGVD